MKLTFLTYPQLNANLVVPRGKRQDRKNLKARWLLFRQGELPPAQNRPLFAGRIRQQTREQQKEKRMVKLRRVKHLELLSARLVAQHQITPQSSTSFHALPDEGWIFGLHPSPLLSDGELELSRVGESPDSSTPRRDIKEV